MDNPFKNPRILSACTGVRGIERGVERAVGETRTIAIVEIEAFIIENLLAGMEAGLVDEAPVWCNLKTFDARPFRGMVDIFMAGYPCQPFSTAGKRSGEQDPRHLWPYIEKIIAATGPVSCFFENVSGHLSLGFDTVYKSLSNMGYAVEAGIFTAEEVGAPHERKRLFILAIRKDYLGYAKSNNQQWHRAAEGRGPQPSGRSGNELAYCYHEHDNWGRQQRKGWRFESSNRSEELDNTSSLGLGQKYQVSAGRHSAFPTGEKFGNPNTTRQPRTWNKREQGEENNNRTAASGSCVVYAGGLHVQRFIRCGTDPERWERQDTGQVGSSDSGDRWPARPGEQQHEWEHPRTSGYTNSLPDTLSTLWRRTRQGFAKMLGKEVSDEINTGIKTYFESRLGKSVNGYRFREDFLRALGNSVVEQTAEVAFITLIKKHGL